jgi:aminopeptidase-like protein
MIEIDQIDHLLKELFPICRSLTGEGNRKTLSLLNNITPLEIHEVPSGTDVFDWKVPDEWSIREAWIKDEDGNEIINFKISNIHVLNYSDAIDKEISFLELKDHVFTLESFPEAIPYRTSYYDRRWGFCMSHNQWKSLDQTKEYHVYIDSDFNKNGSLTYATALKSGTSEKEILLSSYCCHPSLANDNLSGLIASVLLFKELQKRDTFYSYRLVIAPETIGVICFLSQNQNFNSNILGGAVLTTLGGPGSLAIKRSYDHDSLVQKAADYLIRESKETWKEYPFTPDGSDERQYSTPGIRIPTITLCKDKYYEYKEYHTSKDDLNFVKPVNLQKTILQYLDWIDILEMDRVYKRVEGSCEYQLGKRGLYPQTGGANNQIGVKKSLEVIHNTYSMNWLMHGLDGKTSLLDLSLRSGLPLKDLYFHSQLFLEKELIKEVK